MRDQKLMVIREEGSDEIEVEVSLNDDVNEIVNGIEKVEKVGT